MRPRTVARKATGVRLDRVVAAAAEMAARDSHRTVSNLIELALIQYLEREGYLPSEKLRK
jgi:predicted transcriptional regulator